MSRRIVTESDVQQYLEAKKSERPIDPSKYVHLSLITSLSRVEGGAPVADSYTDKLVKLIPAEIVAAFIAINGILASTANPNPTSLWIVFVILWFFTPLYLYRVVDKPEERPTNLHIVISTIAFAIWIFAIGGPFATLPNYQPYYGSIALILFTVLIPIVYGSKI